MDQLKTLGKILQCRITKGPKI